MVVMEASSRSPAGVAVRLLLLAAALLACTATAGVAAAAAGKSSTLCDTAKCGKGNCSEVPFIPLLTAGYKCTCDPGWSQPKLLNLTLLDWAPCIIPDCLFDASCYNFSFLFTPPDGIPLFNPCVFVKCGWGGECKMGDGFSYTCECQPGYTNLLNQPDFPCLKNCSFGANCSKRGILPPAPPPPPSTAPPPVSPSSWRLVQHLLSLAILLLLLQIL